MDGSDGVLKSLNYSSGCDISTESESCVSVEEKGRFDERR